jgi:hypothetical protein
MVMLLTNQQLQDTVRKVAEQRFGHNLFRRRELMDAVEEHIRDIGAWEPEDDVDSQSKGAKSRGLARIDWAISNLKDRGLCNPAHDQWQVPSRQHP